MKKRFARLMALLLTTAMVGTLVPANYAYAKETDPTETQEVVVQETEEGEEVKKVTIDAVTITYADGKAVEDGHMIDFMSAEDSADQVAYEVKDGKLTNWN